MSELAGLFPLAATDATSHLLERVHSRATENLQQIIADDGEEKAHMRRAMRAEKIAFAATGSGAALAAMSVEDVLKLRTGKNWEKASEARRRFFGAVRKLSAETESDGDFERAVREKIADYDAATNDSNHELVRLGASALTPVLKVALPVAGAFVAHLVGFPSWESVLAFGALMIEQVSPELRVQGVDFLRAQRQRENHMGKGLTDIVPRALRA
ncbi:MAG: hypothetical protein EOO73_36260 [Myxococcales bacterium]|nr:MAG: hypothetical protein EOO73_36260 [Myxococcales bacterium]